MSPPETTSQISSVIRLAEPGDRPSIAEVAAASGLFPAEDLLELAATLENFLAGRAGAARWLVDATADGVRGVAYHAPEPMTDRTWNLYFLAVHPSASGRGRGSALVRRVEADLRALGARLLLIETSGVPEFARQRAFYRGLGYRHEATIADFYGRGDDKVIFTKPLAVTLDDIDGGPDEAPTALA